MADRPAFPPAVLEALKKGNKLEAIKLLREASKTGLAEAKAMVEAVQAVRAGDKPAARPAPVEGRRPVGATAVRHVPPMPGYVPHSKSGLSPGEVPRGGGELGWIVVAVVGLVAIFLVL